MFPYTVSNLGDIVPPPTALCPSKKEPRHLILGSDYYSISL